MENSIENKLKKAIHESIVLKNFNKKEELLIVLKKMLDSIYFKNENIDEVCHGIVHFKLFIEEGQYDEGYSRVFDVRCEKRTSRQFTRCKNIEHLLNDFDEAFIASVILKKQNSLRLAKNFTELKFKIFNS